MYLVLIYIILIFLLLISDKNLEGQENNNVDINFVYKGSSNDSDNEFNNSISKITIPFDIKTTISSVISALIKKNNTIPIEYIELLYNDSGSSTILKKSFKNSSGVIEYKKLSDYIGENKNITIDVISNLQFMGENGVKSKLLKDIYDGDKGISDLYSKYVKSYLKNNKKGKNEKAIEYSDKIIDLFNNKSKNILSAFNKNMYIDGPKGDGDDDEYPDKIPGSTDSTLLPTRSYDFDSTENDDNDDNDDNNDNDNKEICCSKSGIQIENQKITGESIPLFIRSLMYEKNNMKMGSFEPYNLNYYDEMDTTVNKYKYLVGSMKTKIDPGRLSYK